MDTSGIPSISSTSTAEWRAQHERDGRVDLWLEDEFNAGSRLVVSLCTASCHSLANIVGQALMCSSAEGAVPMAVCLRAKLACAVRQPSGTPDRG